jgi:ABC-type transport system involved in multi-copper enzyme maturation permease subunit
MNPFFSEIRHLLRIEWMKIRYYRSFKILLIAGLFSLFALNFLAYNYYRTHAGPEADALVASAPFRFPMVWQTVSYLSGFLLFIPGMMVITLIANEMSFRTLRQNIIDGVSRSRFLSIKVLVVVGLSLLFTMAVALCGVILGIVNGQGGAGTGHWVYILYFFLQALSYCGAALLFGLFIKRAGPAIGLFFVYIWFLERIVSGLMNLAGRPFFGNYLPLSTTDRLIPFPFSAHFAEQMAQIRYVPALLLMAVLYLLLYYRFAARRIGQTDL